MFNIRNTAGEIVTILKCKDYGINPCPHCKDDSRYISCDIKTLSRMVSVWANGLDKQHLKDMLRKNTFCLRKEGLPWFREAVRLVAPEHLDMIDKLMLLI